MKLEIGMYVRTKNGCICQILRTTYSKYLSRNKELCYEVDRPINVNMELYDEDILKASYNIIDLIEVGDYVNGDLVLFAGVTIWDNDGNVLDKQVHINHNGYDLWLREEYIKSIVTKEQFESMSYKVERG